MTVHPERHRTRGLLPWLGALTAVLSIAPISVFTAAAVGRLLQPLPNEPAGTEQRIFDWFAALP